MTRATGRPKLERWLASAAFNAYFGFRLREFGAGECAIEAPVRDEFERPGGAVSGPVFMTAADVAIWLAVVTRRGTSQTWVTADLKIGRQLVYAVAGRARPRTRRTFSSRLGYFRIGASTTWSLRLTGFARSGLLGV